MQGPDVGHDIAPGGDLDLHAQVGQDAGHVGDGLLQRQVLALDPGTAVALFIAQRLATFTAHQQRLGVLVDVLDRLDLELGAGLHHFLHRATIDGAQNTLAVLVGDVLGQLDLDPEDLLVAVLGVDDVVLRQPNILGGNIPGVAVDLDEVGRTHRRGGQEVVEGPRRRAVTLVADGLVGDDREVVELGLQAEVVEIVDLDFHEAPAER